MKEGSTMIVFSRNLSAKTIMLNLEQYLYGSITLSIVAGLLSGLIVYILLAIFRNDPVKQDQPL
jgi:hypothetical protein